MNRLDFEDLGIPQGPIRAELVELVAEAPLDLPQIEARLRAAVESPEAHLDAEAPYSDLARAVLRARPQFHEREAPAPYERWGENLDPASLEQMRNACRLPVAVRGAVMPDAHRGYGLPIGGVLATRGAVIPYAVGVDIACRMKMTVLDLPVSTLDDEDERLVGALHRETRFGIGAKFRKRHEHDVMDRNWDVSPVTRRMKDKAWAQLGSSGSGNHFVEFGELVFETEDAAAAFGLEPEVVYLALLSHSGSRGTGAGVASHYSKLARERHPELPRELGHLSWLDLGSEEGQEYWEAMSLMGHYAEANHACIHRAIARHLGVEVLLDVENHHNFAWKEVHDGEEVIVHRKGATPAGEGVLGVIPGSMADNAYLVRGLGSAASLESAAHGAGRIMSRTQAKKTLNWDDANALLRKKRVKLLSAGIDEVPMVYKNIETVMSEQRDLVEPLARFAPRLVKMAKAGERPED